MQDTERQKFEGSWKSAFDGAESTPPESVWNSIELDLAGQESVLMKKKVVFYQRLAAAMVVLALLAGSYGYYASSNKVVERATSNEQRATNVTTPETKVEKNNNSNSSNDNSIMKTEQPVVAVVNHKKEVAAKQQLLAVETADNTIASYTQQENTSINKEEDKKEEQKEVAVVSPLLQQTEQLEQGPETVVDSKKDRSRESLWVALGGSAGNYTPNTPAATTPSISPSNFDTKGPQLAFATIAAPKPQPKVGSSYSVGVGVGKKFGRFVVQTGVNLNKQQINYTSNYDTHTPSNSSKATMTDYLAQSSSDLTFTNEYTVSSTMDIVSIPVQLGYMIVDRRLGWQINAGMSNDFFLRNVLVDKSGQREKSVEEAGSESPYRSVNWSALASTELSYRIGAHYRVSLVPGARYSFHSILKNTTDAGRPVVLDVGFRFRYIFD